MVTGRRQAAHDSGEDIWNRVEKAGEAGLLTEQAVGRNTRSQFERGKAWIKDTKCKSEKKGFVRYHGAYTITVNDNKCTLYATDRLQSLHQQAQRIYNCSIVILPPEAQELPTVRLLRGVCENIFTSMALLEAAGFSPQAAAKAAEASPKKTGASRRSRKTPSR